MAFIDIEVDGLVVRASLNEQAAPQTSKAVWEALPFEGRAVHAQISGDMFRMLEPAPVGELPVESETYTQHPGSVVFFPPICEIAFCVGRAQFSAQQGHYAVTPLAEIEDDFTEWAQRTNNLNFSGTAPIRFRRSADQETPFRRAVPDGPEIGLSFGDATVRARVLADSLGPALADELLAALPLVGEAANHTWAGAMTLVRAERGVRLTHAAAAAATTFHWPGYLYYDPADQQILVCYGDASCNVQGVPTPLVPLARIIDDLAPYAAVAGSQLLEGAKPIQITRT
jgi:hypothetical protein